MSIAITKTGNTMGVRRLSGYAIRPVWRGPAEPGPNAANHPVTMGALPAGQGSPYRFHEFPLNDVRHVMQPAAGAPAGSSASASPTPTGSVVSSYTELAAQIAPSVAQTVSPAANPTSVATVAPASQPGYVVVQSGSNTSPDYVSEIESWLTSTDLLATIFPSVAIPNWIPALVVAAGFTMMMGGGKKR